MHSYSYADLPELAPDVDSLTHETGVLDSFLRDCDDFEHAITADSLDEYWYALFNAARDADIDTRDTCENVQPPHACVSTANLRARSERDAHALIARVTESRRALFDDAVTRYLRRFARA